VNKDEGWAARLVAVLAYFLPSPLKGIFGRLGTGLAEHHVRQAWALSLLLLLIVVSTIPSFLLLSGALAFLGDEYPRWRLDEIATWLYVGFLAAWAFLLLAGIVLAAAGSRRRLPVVARLGGRRWVRQIAQAGWTLLYLLVALATGATLHALHLARPVGGRPPAVHILYDDSATPRWLMALGGYRMELAALARWGDGAFQLSPFDPDMFTRAISESRLVFVGSHGSGGRIYFRNSSVVPQDLAGHTTPGKSLRLVYLTACHGGDSAGWASLLAPARVVTFSRNSLVLEHIAWLWIRAPAVVSDLDEAPPAFRQVEPLDDRTRGRPTSSR
jgi:hypothetical protein